MALPETIIFCVSILVLLSHIGLLVLAVYALFMMIIRKNLFDSRIFRVLRDNAYMLALVTAVLGTLGSLYLSLGVGLSPCDLCWYQRAMLYPQAVILAGILLFKPLSRDASRNAVLAYLLPLNIVGLVVSAYHNIIQFIPDVICSPGSVSCQINYVLLFGYISIPVMSLTAFLMLLTLCLLGSKKQDNKRK